MLPKPAFRFRLLHRQSRLALLAVMSLLAACQTFKDGDQQLYEQSNKLLAESLAQGRAKVAPPLAVQAALISVLGALYLVWVIRRMALLCYRAMAATS